MTYNNVRVAYFSGTGGTALVADAVEKEVGRRGIAVSKHEIKTSAFPEDGNEDLLVLLFAVHAANAPLPVYQWVEQMKPVNQVSAVVISVSGAGEIFPNKGSRVRSIKRLEKKGYNVICEQMLIMPSNMFVATPDHLAAGLIKILKAKVARIIDDVLAGDIRRTRPSIIDKGISAVLEIQKKGSKVFGKGLYADARCNGCGWCETECPAGNIHLSSGKPVFKNQCVMCFRCVYGCPQGAIRARRLRFLLNKDGFDIQKLQSLDDVPQKKTGIIWKGVRKYLSEDK